MRVSLTGLYVLDQRLGRKASEVVTRMDVVYRMVGKVTAVNGYDLLLSHTSYYIIWGSGFDARTRFRGVHVYLSVIGRRPKRNRGRQDRGGGGRARLLSLWYYVRFALLFNFFFTSEHNILVNMQRLHK